MKLLGTKISFQVIYKAQASVAFRLLHFSYIFLHRYHANIILIKDYIIHGVAYRIISTEFCDLKVAVLWKMHPHFGKPILRKLSFGSANTIETIACYTNDFHTYAQSIFTISIQYSLVSLLFSMKYL